MLPHKHTFAPTAPESEPQPSIDSGILAFGSSTSVNAERMRDTNKEIEELKATATSIKKTMVTETKTGEELTKSLQRAAKENATVLYSTSQTVERLDMFDTVLQGHQTTMETEICTLSNPQDSDGLSMATDDESSPSPPGASKSLMAVQKGQVVTARRLEKVTTFIKDIGSKLRFKTQTKKSLKEDTMAMPHEGVRKRLESAKKDAAAHQQVLGPELARKSTIAGNKEKKAASAGRVGEEVRKLEEQIAKNKSTYVTVVKDRRKADGMCKETNAEAKKGVGTLTDELSKLSLTKTATDEQIEQATCLFGERDKLKADTEGARAERNKIFATKSKTGSSLSAAKTTLDRHTNAVLECESTKKAIEADKVKYAELENTKYLQNKTEADDLVEEVEKYEALVAGFTDNKEKEKIDKEVLRALVVLEQVKMDLGDASRALEEKHALVAEKKSAVDERKSAAKRVRELQAEIDDKIQEIQELKKVVALEHENHQRSELTRKVKILRWGAAIIKETVEKELELED